jgi:hypothetical protein
MFPRVEFRRGIPMNLDVDDFFDPQIRNVIVSDDLMSIASKEPRINDLFTEGSHHRNLTVIALSNFRKKVVGPSGVHLSSERRDGLSIYRILEQDNFSSVWDLS